MTGYGPHRPEDADHLVVVLGDGKWPDEMFAPMPLELVAQRRSLNTRAHRVSWWECVCGMWHPPGYDDPHGHHQEVTPDG